MYAGKLANQWETCKPSQKYNGYIFVYAKGTFEVRAKMLLKDFNHRKQKGGKLVCKWSGPYIITHSLGRGLYSLKAIEKPEVIVSRVNGTHLKP